MDVRHLQLLRDLAERGSVTEVARVTQRTPSAVSQQLKAAQRDLGARLVEPDGRGIRLTEAGRLLARGGAEVATAVERVRASWDEFQGAPSGSVSLAGLPSAATFLLPGVLDALREESIAVHCTDIDIAESEFGALTADHDIVLAHSLTGRAPAGTAGLRTVALVREPLDIALPSGHPLARRTELEPGDLVAQDWIGVPSGFPFDTVLQAIERSTGQRLRVTQRLRDNRLIEALVVGGQGVAVLPRFTTREAGGLALRPLRGIPTGRYVFAVLRPDRAERLAVRRVLDALVTVASRLATAQDESDR